ncbi:unnamed protein product [Linum tenue]|uniref:CUE domain-containing protein n=1 Tax=Linum tenue TaxID=586396 RepID=A0AAV0I4Z0_9ROSI|nr:unnamed protein product [Linum tenue]
MASAAVCSARICGTKRLHLFDDEYNCDFPSPYPSPVTKRRRFVPPGLERLQARFPNMEVAVLELALEECGGNIDAAIHRLCRLSLEEAPASKPNPAAKISSDPPTQWVELLVEEMAKATSMDDAKSRAGKVLEALEKAVAQAAGKESKRRAEVMSRENSLLKRAVAILYERQKDKKEKEAESEALKKLVAEYQEKLKTLEANNFALSVHLSQALRGGSISGHCRPDVF